MGLGVSRTERKVLVIPFQLQDTPGAGLNLIQNLAEDGLGQHVLGQPASLQLQALSMEDASLQAVVVDGHLHFWMARSTWQQIRVRLW